MGTISCTFGSLARVNASTIVPVEAYNTTEVGAEVVGNQDRRVERRLSHGASGSIGSSHVFDCGSYNPQPKVAATRVMESITSGFSAMLHEQ